jgi:hypothetical protein
MKVTTKPKKKYYFHGSEVTKTQAKLIKSIGGEVVRTRSDKWIQTHWS